MRIKLIQRRDPGLPTSSWFWFDENERLASPFFNSKEEAMSWAQSNKEFIIEQ